MPPEGFVPTEEVAIKIAEAVLVERYGKRILKERPWQVTKTHGGPGGRWSINGTLSKGKGHNSIGGTVHIEIDIMTGAVSNVGHSK